FLDLPLEIRQQIYTYLLIYPPPDPHSLLRHPQNTSSSLHPAILSVSRQIHIEALPYLYAHNAFDCHPSLLTIFPRLYDPGRRTYPRVSEGTCPGVRLIRRWYLTARLDCGPFWDAETIAGAFSRAEELTVEVRQNIFLGCGGDVLRLFDGVRGVRRVKIWGSTTGLEGYVRWLEAAMMSPIGTEIVPFIEEEE
ncbi:hypothetical protein M406DRAFT_223448, partial [Cryphonectria parasitica EP155]